MNEKTPRGFWAVASDGITHWIIDTFALCEINHNLHYIEGTPRHFGGKELMFPQSCCQKCLDILESRVDRR